MRTFSRTARAVASAIAAGAFFAGAGHADAQNFNNGYNPYYLNNQTYSYGLQLPQVPQPNGQDEIRAADGTTCRSSMASNNAYLDMGGIGGQGQDGSFDSGTVYGRLIVPLGGVPNRLDCSSLYNLEIERLRHELALVRSGATGGAFVPSAGAGPAAKDKAWAEKGWSDGGSKGAETAQKSTTDRIPAATVVPMRLQPTGSINALPPETSASEPVEILPWSNVPAQPARVLAGIRSKPEFKPVLKQETAVDVTMQQLLR